MSDTKLSVSNLSVSFPAVKAVDGISFSLNAGETLGIVGESGSGKSVTVLSILKLINSPGKISSGEISFLGDENLNGKNLLNLSENALQKIRGQKIGMIFQEPSTALNPVLKCGDQVAEVLIEHKKISKEDARKQTIDLFNKVKLQRAEEIFDAYPHQLSGGQKQRVMIAMAICCKPEILIADEPTTALDVTVQKSVLTLLRELKEEMKMSMIFISHDLNVISEVADRVAVMYKGKIVEEGNVSDVLRLPKHPYTKGLFACRPQPQFRLGQLPVIADFMKEKEDGGLIETGETIESLRAKFALNAATEESRKKKIYSSEPILKVNHLTTSFPVRSGIFSNVKSNINAVNDVSFEVYQGETLGLVGESGCGKTTLGRTILRLVQSSSGEIIFKGKEITNLHGEELRKIRRNMQIVFQDPYASLNPKMSIGKAIIEPMENFNLHSGNSERRKKAIELLERVHLKSEHFDRFPHEFSGGQRQRICIARALASNPEFIICDECVTALDVSVQAVILNLLNELKRDFNFTSIFISHDLSVVRHMSDRIMVMKDGRIIEVGESEDVFKSPKENYTKELVESINQSAHS